MSQGSFCPVHQNVRCVLALPLQLTIRLQYLVRPSYPHQLLNLFTFQSKPCIQFFRRDSLEAGKDSKVRL